MLPNAAVPGFMDMPVMQALSANLENAKKEMGFDHREDFWYLRIFSVHPDYQRRGVATDMMQSALRDLVDRDGLEAYLESSPVGSTMYARCGFEERKRVPLVGGKYDVSVMVRPARKSTG